MEITKKQKNIFNEAIELLKPYDKDIVADGRYYFKINEGNEYLLSEYDCCDNYKCLEETLRNIKNYFGENTIIDYEYDDNMQDHENIERCCICDRPFHDHLTWVEYAFIEYEKDELSNSCVAFNLRTIFRSMPSHDKEISDYAIAQNKRGNPETLCSAIQREADLVDKLVKYAEFVIETIRAAKDGGDIVG